MMGMSSPEWSAYMAEQLGVPGTPEQINADIVERMLARYGASPPLIDGAVAAVRDVADRWPVAIASSSNVELIEVVLASAGLAAVVSETVSSEQVARGKPAPDVYLEAARRLGATPAGCAAVEDSHNGIRSAKAAGMLVFAIPNLHYPPGDDSLGAADVVLASITELPDGPSRRGLAGRSRCARRDPSRSRVRRPAEFAAPRSARSRGRTPDPVRGS